MSDVDISSAAIREMESSPQLRRMLGEVADDVATIARRNAAAHYPASRLPQAITSADGTDADGAYADVGYTRTDPGFALWWSEVGTSKMSPRPHLRAALTQVRV